MLEISKFQNEFLPVLDEFKLTLDDIVMFARTDMQGERLLGDSLLILTSDILYVVYGQNTVKGDGRTHLHCEFVKNSVLCLPLEKTESLAVESMVSSAALVSKCGEKQSCVCYTTNKYKEDILLFSEYFKQYKEKGEITPSDKDKRKEKLCPKCGGRYPDPARKICPRCMDKKGLLKRLLPFAKGYGASMAAIVFTLLLLSALGVVAPYISSSFFYDNVLSEGGEYYGRVGFTLMLVVLTTICRLAVNAVSGCISAKVSGNVVYNMKKTIFSSINRLSMSFFTGRQTGGLMTQINNDANSIYWLFVDGLPYFLVNIVQFIAVLIIMLVLNPLLAVLSISVVPLFAFIISRIIKKMRTLQMKRYAANRAMNAVLSDSLSGVRVVKAFAREDEECKRFNSRSVRFEENNKNVTVYNNTAFPIANTVMYLSTLIVWGVGGWMVMSNYHGMLYGTLLTFVSYVGMLNAPLINFIDMTHSLSECVNALQRLFEIADAEPDVRQSENARDIEIKGRVEFDNVEFSYTKERKIIDGVSFDVGCGECLGIVGHTGAGKSTLVNLLIRLYDVTGGCIKVDGVDVKDIKLEKLRESIAIVSQETYLFAGSILENIKYACPNASLEQVINASMAAGAHDFIVKLPDGYDTQIGFGNKDLSGGEKQRLSIARAILKDPKILILDEATAAMDTQTERKIQNALDALRSGRTTIMIAHRLSTLRSADKLIVIENGKMPECGTHKELLEKRGIYHKLYKLQAEAMKNIGIEA